MLTATTHPDAARAWRERLTLSVQRILAPPPKLAVSEWSDAYRVLTSENSAEAGPWSTARTPYLREIMDCFSDPDIERIVVMKGSRVGATEGIIDNVCGYFIDQDPSAILVVQPTQDDAEKWSKEKLVPMLESSPRLRERMPSPRAKDAANTILNKQYPGGKLGVIGANAPRLFRQRDFRIVLCDEIDGYPLSAGSEGDPVALAFKRADNFDNRKLLLNSSPTLTGASRIERAYNASDRRRWHVQCPQCGHLQVWRWGGRDTPYGFKWAHRKPASTVYICAGNGCEITERYKRQMGEGGVWIPEAPEILTRGYHVPALISLLPGARWSKLVTEWMEAQGNSEQLQVFVNTVLGETYEEKGERAEASSLAERREDYPAEVPAAVGVLTAFVDVHPDRLEVLVRGWGAGQESWFIRHDVIDGDPDGDQVWETLDIVLFRAYQHESGALMRIRAAGVDSGYRTTAVYQYAKPRQSRGVRATKGDKQNPNAPILVRAKKPNDMGVKLLTVGTFAAKRRLFSRLKMRKPGPGYMHFRRPDEANQNGATSEFLRQFEAEKLTTAKDQFGQRTYRYEQVEDRNEAIDLEVGCLTMLYALGAAVYEHLEHFVAKVAARGAKLKTQGEPPAQSDRVDPVESEPMPVESEPRPRESARKARKRPRTSRFVGRFQA